MKLRFSYLAMLILTALCSHAGLEITGSKYVTITPPASSGLEEVYVLNSIIKTNISYRAASESSKVTWYRFNSMGAGILHEVIATGSPVSTVRLQKGDMGYLIEENGRQHAFWIIDYSQYEPSLSGITIDPESDCDRVLFSPNGTFDKITYYSVTGAPIQLDREIKLEYTDLELESEANDESSAYWKPFTKSVNFAAIDGRFSVPAPLCNTQFHLYGDRFLEAWDDPISVITDTYITKRVDAKTWAIQQEKDNDNEQASGNEGLGGSAPCDITFVAIPSEAAIFTEWQFSATEDFEDVLYRFSETELTYTFNESGTTYVRFVCADSSGECTYEGEVYTVSVGESKLLCPNAFSPHNQDGVNDLWKVSYSSIVSYDCHIFNRWGKELFHSTNPAEGWDGKIGGKFVPSGVYFYVIKAKGADGVTYNLKGDINIVGSKLRPSTGDSEE